MNTTLHRITLLSILFSFFFSFIAVSQTLAIEELEKALNKHSRNDTTKVNLLIKLGYEIYSRDAKRAGECAKQAEKLSTQLNYPKGKAASLWITGMATNCTSKEKLKYYEEVLRIAEEIGDKTGICYYLLAISNVQQKLGNMEASDQAIEKGLTIAVTLKDRTPYIKLLYNSANHLSHKGDHLQAMKKYRQALLLATQNKDKVMMAKSNSSIATIFYRQGYLVQALEYYLSAFQISEEQNDKQGICEVLINMGTHQGRTKRT